MKILAGMLATALTAVTLSGCSVTAEESKACADKEGIVVTRSFKMHDQNQTESFTFCEVNGKIKDVFNSEDPAVPEKFNTFCEDNKGKVYGVESKSEEKQKGEDSKEKTITTERRQSYICVAEGEVVKSFFQRVA